MRSQSLVMVVAFGLFLDYCLYGAVIPLTPLSPLHIVDEEQLGILYGGYAVSAMLLPPLFGYFGDRLGERFLMIGGSVAQGVTAALFAYAPSFSILLAARFCQGAASAAVWTAGLALVASHYRKQRVKMIGYAFFGGTIGMVLGPLLGGGLYRSGGYRFSFDVLGLLIALEIVLQIMFLPKAHKQREATADLRPLLLDKSALRGALAIAMAALAWGILEPLLPARLIHRGISVDQIGLIFTVSAVVYGLCAPLVGWTSERISTRKTLLLGMIAMAIVLPLLSLVDDALAALLVLCLVDVTYAYVLNPASAELGNVVDRLGLTCYSTAYAAYNVAYSAGMILSTIIASMGVAIVGFGGSLLCVSAILLLSGFALVGEAAPQGEAGARALERR